MIPTSLPRPPSGVKWEQEQDDVGDDGDDNHHDPLLLSIEAGPASRALEPPPHPLLPFQALQAR